MTYKRQYAKYGEYPIISQSTKDMIAENVKRMNRGNVKIK